MITLGFNVLGQSLYGSRLRLIRLSHYKTMIVNKLITIWFNKTTPDFAFSIASLLLQNNPPEVINAQNASRQQLENERTNVYERHLLQSINLKLVTNLRALTCQVIITKSYSLLCLSPGGLFYNNKEAMENSNFFTN